MHGGAFDSPQAILHHLHAQAYTSPSTLCHASVTPAQAHSQLNTIIHAASGSSVAAALQLLACARMAVLVDTQSSTLCLLQQQL